MSRSCLPLFFRVPPHLPATDVYDGKWQDGRCHGFGKFTYPDGQVFEGEWKDGRREGAGKLYMPSGEVIAGTWVADSLSGPVKRYHASEEAGSSASARPATMAGVPAPASASSSGPSAAPAAGGAPAASSSSAAATEAADVAWLRESHDVIWQLNVELQMENERLVGENRRLRLKLRQMLQQQQQQQQQQPGGANGGANNGGCGCGGANGGGGDGKPKVVEGRLRRKSKKEGGSSSKGSKEDKAWLEKLMSGNGSELEAFLSGKTKDSANASAGGAPSAESDADRKRRLAEELCAKAENELTDRLLSAEWGPLKRLGNPGDAEAYARSVLKEKLSRVRHSAAAFLGDGPSLQQAASDARQGLDAVLDWPVRLGSMQSRTGLDADGMLRATELKIDYCGLQDASVGAACVLLRASRALQTVDLSGNQIGDEGARMLCDVLKGNTSLKSLRLASNAIGASGGTALADLLLANRTLTRLDVRGNIFDSRAEQALRSAGGERVIIHDADERLAPAAAKGTTADSFLAYADAKHGGTAVPAAPSNAADAFLEFTDRKAAPPPPAPSARDAEAFLSFSRGSQMAAPPPPAPPPPPKPTAGGGGGGTSADSFLAFTGGGSTTSGGSGSFAKPSLGLGGDSKPKGVSFGGSGGGSSATKPSGLGAGAVSASDFLASLGD